MRRNIFSITSWLIVIYAFGCSQKEPSKKADHTEVVPQDTPTIENRWMPEDYFENGGMSGDTLIIGDRIFILKEISESEFDSYFVTPPDFPGEDNPFPDSTVSRINGSLTFLLRNEKKVMLEDRSFGQEESSYRYIFRHKVPDSDFWAVSRINYEWVTTTLVNQINGQLINTVGIPASSPDQQYILCGNSDLETRYTASGFELFRYENGQLQLIGKIAFKDWGPSNLKWISNTSVVIQQERLKDGFIPVYSYREMRME